MSVCSGLELFVPRLLQTPDIQAASSLSLTLQPHLETVPLLYQEENKELYIKGFQRHQFLLGDKWVLAKSLLHRIIYYVTLATK